MTLAGRLAAFFLAALALVLIGFSVSIYLLARTYLHRQVDDRLESALDTLTAAAEVKPEGVEWEPQQLRLTLGQDSDVTQVRWVVYDEQGRRVDHSRNLGAEGLFEESVPVATDESVGHQTDHKGQPWLLRQRTTSPLWFSGRALLAAKEGRRGGGREGATRSDLPRLDNASRRFPAARARYLANAGGRSAGTVPCRVAPGRACGSKTRPRGAGSGDAHGGRGSCHERGGPCSAPS